MKDLLILDGRVGEGGGQMLRLAVVVSTLTGLPFRMVHIRAGRTKPGLKRQHLAILEILTRWTGARAEPLEVGATELTFTPGKPAPADLFFDLHTAGSIPLVLQSLLPLALFAPARVRFHLKGGTDVPFSPTILWVKEVVLPYLQAWGRVDLEIRRHGFYPRGGGEVVVTVDPRSGSAPPLPLCHPLDATAIRGVSLASEDLAERKVAERQARSARDVLSETGVPVDIAIRYVRTRSPGTSLTLWAETRDGLRLGADALGKRGKPAEGVGEEASRKLLDALARKTVDEHLADHLLLWLALQGGCLAVPRWTGHLESGVYVLSQFFGPGVLMREGQVLRSPGIPQHLNRSFA